MKVTKGQPAMPDAVASGDAPGRVVAFAEVESLFHGLEQRVRGRRYTWIIGDNVQIVAEAFGGVGIEKINAVSEFKILLIGDAVPNTAIALAELLAWCGVTVVENKTPGYTPEHGGTMGDEENTEDELVTLARKVPSEKRGPAIDLLKNLFEAGSETTGRAKATPRLKWEKDALPDEDPATFAWRAYEADAKAGTLHRGVISTEDPPLHRKLKNWLRTYDMPEGIDIPTLPEWNNRQVDKLAILRDDATVRETVRLAAVVARRRAQRMPGM
jgi:hypothetical protein